MLYYHQILKKKIIKTQFSTKKINSIRSIKSNNTAKKKKEVKHTLWKELEWSRKEQAQIDCRIKRKQHWIWSEPVLSSLHTLCTICDSKTIALPNPVSIMIPLRLLPRMSLFPSPFEQHCSDLLYWVYI